MVARADVLRVAAGAGVRAQLRLSVGVKVLYGIGEIANAGKTALFGIYLLFFYASVMGLPGTLVGVAAAIGLLWDAIIDPLIGHASDRIVLPLGRRHGCMLAGAVLFGVAFWALFSPPRGLSTEALFVWFLGMSMLVRLGNSLFTIPHQALGAELSANYYDRTGVTAIRGACALLGTMGLASLSFVVFFPNVGGGDPKLRYEGYPAMGFGLGLTMAAAALIATAATLPWRSAGAGRRGETVTFGFRHGFTVALRNEPFRALLLSFSLVFLATVINATLAVYFMTYYAGIVDSSALSAQQLAFYFGAVAGVPLWLRLSRAVEKRRLYLVGVGATLVVMIAAVTLVGEGHLLGTGDVRPLLVGQTVAGVFGSVFWVVPASMVADVVDHDELATGVRREGVFFGLFSFGQQIAAGISLLVTGVLVEWFVGLVPQQLEQSPQTVERIGVLFGLLPAMLMALALVLIRGYPLDAARVGLIQRELARRNGSRGGTHG